MPSGMFWNFLEWLHFLALGVWIGGITFLCAIAAPTAHRSLASKAVAGEIVGKMLAGLNRVEIGCWGVLMATTLAALRLIAWKTGIAVVLAGVAGMGILTAVYAFYLAPKLRRLKKTMARPEEAAREEALRLDFERLHRAYVRLMTLNLVLGLFVLYDSVVFLR